MKNLSYLLLSFLFFAISCEEDKVTYDGASYALFAKADSSFKLIESDITVEIPASIMANYGSDVTLTATVDTEKSTAVEGVDFSFQSNSIVIPAGSVNGSFAINLPVASAVTSGKKIVLNISSPDIDNATFNTEHTVEVRLACPLPADFALQYGVQVQSPSGQSYPTHLQTVTPDLGQENTFKVASIWGPEFVATATGNPGYSGQYLYSGSFTVNCDNTVTFTGDESWAQGGTGTYDPNTGFITGTITQSGLFTNDFDINVTFIPAQ